MNASTSLSLTCAFCLATGIAAAAPTIPNPSFELDATPTNFPGYISGNASITGWTTNDPTRTGLNPGVFGGFDTPFADNGIIPQGARVAFVQSTGGMSTLSTSITGLTAGTWYRVQFRANSRSATSLVGAACRINGGEPMPFGAPAGGYSTVTALFKATATSAALEISNTTSADSTLLLDNFTISAATPIMVTSNADSGAGSLRAALTTAAGTPAFNVITFAPALNGGSITLSTELAVNDSGGVAVDASSLSSGCSIVGSSSRLINISAGSVLSLSGLSLTGGNALGGGAIINLGVLRASRCLIANNTASFGGGGIACTSTSVTVLEQCTISGNTAAYGGGISSDGWLVLSHCTVSNNTGTGGTGGLVLATKAVRVVNSIVAGNNDASTTNEDIGGAGAVLTLDGSNFIGVQSDTPAYAALMPAGSPNVNGDYVGTAGSPLNPQLSTLANNGGPSKTLALATASPARNAAVGSTITSDQRGFPIVGVPDIGAFELQAGGTFLLDDYIYKANEGGAAEIVINRQGSTAGTCSVRLVTTPGTAAAADFVGRPNTSVSDVIFGDGESAKTVWINLLADSTTEGEETFTVKLSNPSPGAALDAPSLIAGSVKIKDAFLVANTNDSGAGSLRQALTDAANHAGPDSIGFAASLANSTIHLVTQLNISDADGVVVDATSIGGLTLSGDGVSRCFSLISTDNLTLRRLTLTAGHGAASGGLIISFGTLRLTDCTLSGTTTTLGGGAVYNQDGLFSATRCTFMGNNAREGGAVLSTTPTGSSTQLTQLTRCTFSGNTASTSGGAVHNNNGTTTLVHCTIAGNTAPATKGSGIASYGDSLTETIVDKCIVAGNTNSDVDFVDSSSNNSFTSAGSNVIGTGNATGDFSSTPIGDVNGVQPLLAALADNGGFTQTRALLPGSLALDRAASSTSRSDQRGVSIVGAADSGAFEVEASTTFSLLHGSYIATEGRPVHCTIHRKGNFRGTASVRLVTVSGTAGPSDYTVRPDSPVSDVVFADGETSKEVLVYPLLDSIIEPFPNETFTLRLGSPSAGSSLGSPAAITVFVSDSLLVTNTNDDGPGSLRATIKAADTLSGGNLTVQFAPALSGKTITLGSEIVIDQHDTVTIDASSLPSGITIDGAGYTRLFYVPSGKKLTLRAMTLSGGNGSGAHANGSGGAIYTEASSTLTLERCTLSGNTTTGISTTGGAIYSAGTAVLTQCSLAGNASPGSAGSGGAVVNLGTLTVVHCTFTGNSTGGFGGGIFNNGPLTLNRCILAGNSSFLNPSTGDIVNYTTLSFTGQSIVVNMVSVGSITNPGNQSTSDPLLLPLASNGGPTKTCALQGGSPALNAGAGSTITSDQRGFRIIDVPDLGAYETQLGGSFAFGATGFFANEASLATITIKRLGGNEGTAIVRVVTQTGTASAADFTARPDTGASDILFNDGQDTATITILLASDTLVEPNEVFSVKLSSPSAGTTLGSVTTASVVIIDASSISGDTKNPSLPVITYPAANAEIGVDVGGSIEVSGTVSDDKAIGAVYVTPAGSAPVLADRVTPKAPTTVWKATLTPVTGLNSFTVSCTDGASHTSPTTAPRSFKVLRPLIVSVSGNGSVTSGFTPKSYREVGKPYTLTATQGAGAMFVNWTILSTHTAAQIGLSTTDLQLPVINFIHREGLALRANFAASPYNSNLTGIYNGAIKPNATLPTLSALDTEGFASFTLQSNGAFTGNFKLDGGTLPPVNGVFDASGIARFGPSRSQIFVISRVNKSALSVNLQIDITPPLSNQITGTLSILDGSNRKCDITADRAVYSVTNLVPSTFLNAGNTDAVYTIAFVPGSNPGYTTDQFPQGTGIGYYKLTKTGSLTLAGTLADGTPVTGGSTLSGANTWRLFTLLYSNKGLIASNMSLITGDPSLDLSGSAAVWIRPVLDMQHYPGGWPTGISFNAAGAKLTVTPAASIVPGLPVGGAADVRLDGGLLPSMLTLNTTISAADIATNASSDTGFTLKIDRKTGLYSGTFTHTDGTKTSYQGVIINKISNNLCPGFFLTTTPKVKTYTGQSGGVELHR